MSSPGLDDLLQAQTRAFTALAWRTRLSVSHLSRGLLPGEFRSQRLSKSRSEPHLPRVFLPDDDTSLLDMRGLAALVNKSLAEALFNEQLRLLQSQQSTETEFVTITDLSRSMLGGCFGDATPLRPRASASRKVAALYQAICLFQSLAESAGFAQRVVLAQSGRVVETHRARSPREYAVRTMIRMTGFLSTAYRHALAGGTEERTTLRAALRCALAEVRVHNVILIVSDFLDDVSTFATELTELAARHHVVLIDVADEFDNKFPEPGFWDLEAQRVRTREGARHLEDGITECAISRTQARNWNEGRVRQQQQLARFRRLGVQRLRFFGLDHPRAYARAHACVNRIP